MITASTNVTSELVSPVRDIRARVELYNGSTLIETCNCNDRLIKFDIQRIGDESRFFGYGICQRLNVHLIDKDRELDITTAYTIKVSFIVGDEVISPYPTFKVSEARRDENTNELSVTAYDYIYPSSQYEVNSLELSAPYTIMEFAEAAAAKLGITTVETKGVGSTETCFTTAYESGANFEGTEILRDALDDVAEATQTIYYLDSNNHLIFKRLSEDEESVLTIRKDDYITLTSRTNRRLAKIVHVTELGDDVAAAITQSGTTQYIRENPFWELRDDITTLVNNALAVVGGLCINQFDCDWRGNFLLEPGDKIKLTAKDGGLDSSFVLNDTVNYEGYLTEDTSWSYSNSDAETEETPATVGDTLRQTYAKVNKVDKQVQLVASSVDGFDDRIGQIEITTDQISSTVSQVKTDTEASVDGVQKQVDALTERTQASMTADGVKILIQQELQEGAVSVKTSTGYTFDDTGLTIEKSGSEMHTTITEDGMKIYRSNDEVLTVNNVGVEATNLHATTYLIIGVNSRFEDYADKKRTGCFWIGE